MKHRRSLARAAALAAPLALAGCVQPYTLVQSAADTPVAHGAMHVRPAHTWNRAPQSPLLIAQEEDWTQNGPLLDQLVFMGGVPDGQPIARQRPKAEQQVPTFHAAMSPQDLVSMIESYYRIQAEAKLFETTGVQPATLAGKPAMRFDYTYVGADGVKRRGRTVTTIVDGKLYLLTLNGAASHYFEASVPDFEALVASAVLG